MCWDWKPLEILFCWNNLILCHKHQFILKTFKSVGFFEHLNFGIFNVTIGPWFHFTNAIFLKTFLPCQEKRMKWTNAAIWFVANTVWELFEQLFREKSYRPNAAYFSYRKNLKLYQLTLNFYHETFGISASGIVDIYSPKSILKLCRQSS